MISRVTAAASTVAFLTASAFTLTLPAPAFALTMKECSAKYQAAGANGSAANVKWNDFRKAQCGADATAEPETTLNSGEDTEPAAPTAKAPSGVSFPKAVSPKYSSKSPGRACMHTCVDSYRAAKANNALGGLKWIQKGGGYYSLCNARLKG
ncbi:hypothetical protein [Rhizobium binxianense]